MFVKVSCIKVAKITDWLNRAVNKIIVLVIATLIEKISWNRVKYE